MLEIQHKEVIHVCTVSAHTAQHQAAPFRAWQSKLLYTSHSYDIMLANARQGQQSRLKVM